MTDILCITCGGRRTIVIPKAATHSNDPRRMRDSSDTQQCPSCKGTGRVKLNP